MCSSYMKFEPAKFECIDTFFVPLTFGGFGVGVSGFGVLVVGTAGVGLGVLPRLSNSFS